MLPWVSRTTADFWRQAALDAERRAASLHESLTSERDRYERLVEKLTEMQRAGFTSREPVRYQETTPALPPEVMEALAARAPGQGSEVGRHLLAFAVEALAEGQTAQQVADAIWQGGAA